ncbi:sigma-70 family RNA polymerase sigma factor [Streptomyces liangshanensis]|uniref:sigma-70 family RNA polymerase sigma factor n=1 Tax=Streptomyces liangshanensis TaxID=2717324 RepID=UPI0036DD1A14
MKPQASPKILPAMAEPETLRLARAGDRDAFADLYNEHRGAVYTFIQRKVYNPHLADDLTQDVFVRALSRLETYAWQGRGFGAWLNTIARNLVTDHFKRSSTRRETTVAEMFDADEVVASAEEAALDHLSRAERRAAVATALAFLSPGQRAVLERRYLQDMSVQEAAASMNTTTGAVKTMTYRAMQAATGRLAPLRGAA